MMRLAFPPSIVLLAPLIASCVVYAEDRSQEWIRRHASADMRCPMGQLTVHHFTATPHRKRVEGCGQNVVYVEACEGNRCTWRREGGPPSPVQPPNAR